MSKIEIIANIIAFIGCSIMVATGFIKTKKSILVAQNVQLFLQGLANFLLGGITGAVSNVISVIRNIYCLKFTFSLPVKLVFIAIQAVFTQMTNNSGLIGWLPFIACVIFISVLDTQNEIVLKSSLIVGEACWITYDLYIKNYTGCAFDCFTVISTIIGIFLILRGKKKNNDVL